MHTSAVAVLRVVRTLFLLKVSQSATTRSATIVQAWRGNDIALLIKDAPSQKAQNGKIEHKYTDEHVGTAIVSSSILSCFALVLDSALLCKKLSGGPVTGMFLSFLGAVCLTVQNLCYHISSRKGLLLSEGLLIRSCCFTVISAAKLLYTQEQFLPSSYPCLFVARTAFGFLQNVCLWLGMSVLPLTEAVTVYATLPFWALLFSRCASTDEVSFVAVISMMISFVGILLILQPHNLFSDVSKNVDTIIATLITLGGAISAGISAALLRVMRKDLNTDVIIFWVGLCGILLTPLAMLVEYHVSGGEIVFPSLMLPHNATFITGITWLLMGISSFLMISFYTASLQFTAAGPVTTIFQSTELLCQWIIGVYFLHEELNTLGVLGASIIVVSGILICRT